MQTRNMCVLMNLEICPKFHQSIILSLYTVIYMKCKIIFMLPIAYHFYSTCNRASTGKQQQKLVDIQIIQPEMGRRDHTSVSLSTSLLGGINILNPFLNQQVHRLNIPHTNGELKTFKTRLSHK